MEKLLTTLRRGLARLATDLKARFAAWRRVDQAQARLERAEIEAREEARREAFRQHLAEYRDQVSTEEFERELERLSHSNQPKSGRQQDPLATMLGPPGGEASEDTDHGPYIPGLEPDGEPRLPEFDDRRG